MMCFELHISPDMSFSVEIMLKSWQPWDQFDCRVVLVLSCTRSTPNLQPPALCLVGTEYSFPGENGRIVTLNSHIYAAPSLRRSGSLPPFSLFISNFQTSADRNPVVYKMNKGFISIHSDISFYRTCSPYLLPGNKCHENFVCFGISEE